MAVRRGGAGTPARRGSAAPERGEIYLEYSLLSGQMRVAAIDAETGVEVVVFGPANVSQDDIGQLAVRKLKRRLAASADDGSSRPDPTGKPDGSRYA